MEFRLVRHLVVQIDKNDGQISKESAVKALLASENKACRVNALISHHNFSGSYECIGQNLDLQYHLQ